MRPGMYRDGNGVVVRVQRTRTGYTLTYPGGRVVAIGGAR